MGDSSRPRDAVGDARWRTSSPQVHSVLSAAAVALLRGPPPSLEPPLETGLALAVLLAGLASADDGSPKAEREATTTPSLHGIRLVPDREPGGDEERRPRAWRADLGEHAPAVARYLDGSLNALFTLGCMQAPNAVLHQSLDGEVELDGGRLRLELPEAALQPCRYSGIRIQAFWPLEDDTTVVLSGRAGHHPLSPCTLDASQVHRPRSLAASPVGTGTTCDTLSVQLDSIRQAWLLVRRAPDFACTLEDTTWTCRWSGPMQSTGLSESAWDEVCRAVDRSPGDPVLQCLEWMP